MHQANVTKSGGFLASENDEKQLPLNYCIKLLRQNGLYTNLTLKEELQATM
jgi:hypothetical protein